MDTKFSKPKGFGEILDHTFSLTKNRFKDFFLISLIFMGPVYLLQAIMELVSGTSFFREMGSGNVWFEQILSGFTETGTMETSGFGADIGIIIVGLIGAILGLVAEAAILFAIANIRKNEEYTVGSVIKQAFSRFWPMIGSSILFGIITVMIIAIPIILVTVTALFGFEANPVLGVLGAILLFLGFAIGIGLLLTRWSFYFASVVLDKDSPGLERSWRLSRKRTWTLMGLYIVFYLIISAIELAVQMTFGLALGNSVLLSLISNLATLITTMIFSVGYAVMYLDLKTRHEGDDLKEMIENYNTKTI
ncbi:hypothetical protein ACFVSW_01445 [Neobacillus sp. NPDC058068]|uniref:hypothetical protein n=1 Tax=Neobacillus sp. NPDC058068 TaxID=3346325 RepID=UPI0036DC4E78